ncbi:MAG: sulfur transferase domain-containing protein [Planctomycetota bacterium]|nr:sulfur transferase domain-containing protein [Planctomycetota bacterium]
MKGRACVLVAAALASTVALSAPPHRWINDGTQSEPRLSVEQSIWGMGGLPRGVQEWALEEQVAKIASGFDGFMVFLPPSPREQERYGALARKHGLEITLQCAPSSAADLQPALEAVRRMKARGLVAMVRPTFVTYDEGARKIRELMAAAERASVPFYVETHRGTITQDLLLTGRWAEDTPGIQFHADLSHFVISYEIAGEPRGLARKVFDAVLSRSGMIDGRIGNGEQVQIDIGPRGESRHARRFARWWKQAMVSWLEKAGPGDVFVFKSELGPPNYSILGADGEETSDRWAQALVVRDLGIRTWNEAVREAGRGQPYERGARRKPRKSASPSASSGDIAAKLLEPKEGGIPVSRGSCYRLGSFYLAGQPFQPDFVIAREKGVKTVINVRMEQELGGLGFNVRRAVEGIGLTYVHIPVAPETIDDALAEKFLKAMREAEKPVLLQGSNGNRVWGLWALYIGVEHGISLEATRKVAARCGVKKLVVDDFVQKYLAKKGTSG